MDSSEIRYPLPPLNINPALVTAAGNSFGSMGAHNLHVVMSQTIKGVGLLNGALYGIDESEEHPIVLPEGRDEEEINFIKNKELKRAVELVRKYEKDGLIEPVKNLEGSPVFIYSGENDVTIPPIN